MSVLWLSITKRICWICQILVYSLDRRTLFTGWFSFLHKNTTQKNTRFSSERFLWWFHQLTQNPKTFTSICSSKLSSRSKSCWLYFALYNFGEPKKWKKRNIFDLFCVFFVWFALFLAIAHETPPCGRDSAA